MSRASISTGGIDLPRSDKKSNNTPHDSSMPLHIAILGDFSGRKNRGVNDPSTISQRKVIEINRDNFDEVFATLQVELNLPIADQPLSFKEMDDLHPDFIYDRIPLFDKMRILKRKLKKREGFTEAAEEITAWATFRNQQTETATPEGIPLPDNLLDAVLQRNNDISFLLAKSPVGDIDNLIKDIVKPYLVPKADPRQQDMLKAVDEATSDLMRKIMHHSDFQQLEASWRALYLLVRRIETNVKLKLFLIDISQEEVRADLSSATTVEQSALFKLLVEKRQVASGTPFSLMLGDYQLGNTDQDANLATALATIAATANATWLSAAHEHMAGSESLGTQPDVDDWLTSAENPLSDGWQALRKSPSALHFALNAPRFMLRLPYGASTTSMENFDYEELPQSDNHDYYLWGNSAYMSALLLAESYSAFGWEFQPGRIQEVSDLPLHVYTHESESVVKPCAEILLTDRGAERLTQAGLLPIRSVNAKDSIRIPSFDSIAENRATIRGPWKN